MSGSEPGPQPEPTIEPGEPLPGGVDAVPQDTGDDPAADSAAPVAHDAHPDNNPETGGVPGEMKEGEDTSTKATEATGHEDDEDKPTGEDEAPA